MMKYSSLAYARNIYSNARAIAWWYREYQFEIFEQLVREHIKSLHLARKAVKKNNYQVLNHENLATIKKTRRVFVFGSGYSLNSITDSEWQRIGAYDTLGFSGSFHLQKVPITYHLFRGWVETSAGSLAWRDETEAVCQFIDSNPWLKDTVFVLQEGLTAIFSNRLIGYGVLPNKYRIAFYLPDKLTQRPHRSMREGLAHRMGGLCSAVSLAVALGYEEIVMTGVDLYDSRYFWLKPDQTLCWSESDQRLVPADQNLRGIDALGTHNTVHNGIIQLMGDWHSYLKDRYRVELSVYNPDSLLTATVPVFSWDL